jgi:hypothetical protein
MCNEIVQLMFLGQLPSPFFFLLRICILGWCLFIYLFVYSFIYSISDVNVQNNVVSNRRLNIQYYEKSIPCAM